MLSLIAALLLSAGPGNEWTRQDTVLELAFVAVTAVDALQTATDIAPRCLEANPLLGHCPSAAKVFGMIGAGVVAHALIARVLPRKYRTIWQSAWIGVETATVARNHWVGARIKW